jgi:hypothetical protein
MTSPLAKQVMAANQRAKSMGVAGTLTALDWRRTLDAFGWRCAYCGKSSALTIDHFVPLATWGGTTSQSNCVPSCLACNRLKANTSPDDQALSFVAPERLVRVRAYLQEVGRWRQESWRRTWEHVPKLARDQRACEALKRFCEERARVSDDPHAAAYALLCRRIFGVPWDPAIASQVLSSLRWQRANTSDPRLVAACIDALRFFAAQLAEDSSPTG